MPSPRAPRPRVLVTRPEPEASAWVAQFTARGLDAVALPLIEIAAPRAMLAADVSAWPAEPNSPWRALMFVSGHAVQHFMASPDAAACLAHSRCWAPGPGTARALRAAGVPASQIDSPGAEARQFDSESLWQQVQGQVQAGDRVLIVRGVDAPAEAEAPLPPERAGSGSGREWLSQRVRDAGGTVAHRVVYERRPPAANPARQALARQAARDGSWWLFSSSEAIRHLQDWLPGQDWRAARALVTHPRIGEAAQSAGFGRIQATRPTLEDVAASIESSS
ncbi:uroporphyrinogen-III synthase [Curvibacter sp. HBC28]|uniref:Uroporphyrinogen-III synthase n=1 Tax=Curvibacter microcysteis TaxID=3026419 RepID=A0ABT5MKX4_9BURK|nr:uroporphyrinogen-III synthase [Curvibacter sp. HBC28]MDD0817237.1 uroporphyrinogen-III synthase [Curvibacter sp. HBC28]